jgi:hypothetical protein
MDNATEVIMSTLQGTKDTSLRQQLALGNAALLAADSALRPHEIGL